MTKEEFKSSMCQNCKANCIENICSSTIADCTTIKCKNYEFSGEKRIKFNREVFEKEKVIRKRLKKYEKDDYLLLVW